MLNNMKSLTTRRLKQITGVIASGVLAGAWTGAGAALGIPDRPLFLANDVQANIFFALDDSGSMDFGVVVAGSDANASFEIGLMPSGTDNSLNGTLSQCGTSSGNDCYFWPSPIRTLAGSWSNYHAPSVPMLQRIAETDDNAAENSGGWNNYGDEAKQALMSVWRIWNHNHNTMWYNPTVRYTPWVGKDEDGNAYTNADPEDALLDPYDANGDAIDLTTDYSDFNDTYWQGREWDNSTSGEGRNDGYYPAMYMAWIDRDGDGVLEVDSDGDGSWTDDPPETNYTTATDAGGREFYVPVAVEIKAANAPFTGGAGRTDCADPMSCSYEEEIQNFANWFQYYRTRILVLKAAVSQLIQDSSERMGVATINNNNSVGKPMTDMTVEANKNALMTELFKMYAQSGTALRTLLNRVGHYYDQTDSGSSQHSSMDGSFSGTLSPILAAEEGGECQQNFTLLFTDGYWNDSTPESIGNTDGDDNTSWDGGPHADTHSNTLADYAMRYYERDLSSTLDNTVSASSVDPNEAQHMVTYGVAFGVPGTLTDEDVDYLDHQDDTAPPPWPQPSANDPTTVDDLRHAAFNSRGLFLSAGNPQDLIDELADVLADIGDRLGTASAVAATSQSIQTGTLIFQGLFDTTNWDGKLFARNISANGQVGGTAVWEASEEIPAHTDRSVWTWNGTNAGVEFLWANMSATQQSELGSEDILNYIRGDISLEQGNGGAYRNRDSLLGDIIDSNPVAVTSEQAPLPFDRLPGSEGSSYLSFYQTKLSRRSMVYVGANDGMLHGFATDDGVEQFSYVPNVLMDKLDALANVNYSHKYYVDGGLTASDAYIGGSWKSVLLGTPGRGGKSVFALNVSNPVNFNATHVLWEFTHPELGTITGSPAVARIGNCVIDVNGGTDCSAVKWVAIFGNGYNSDSETAKLFIVDLATGALLDAIDTNNSITDNGLSTPLLVDVDGDFSVEYAYAGDLQGNMWKFDLTGNSSSDWGVASMSNASAPAPLYTAVNTDGDPQPITSRPGFAFNPNGGYNIVFGTGKLLETGDEVVGTGEPIDTLYGINDRGLQVPTVGSRNLPGSTQPSSVLQPQEVTFEDDVETTQGTTQGVGVLSQNAVDYANQYGWYLDLVLTDGGRDGAKVIADIRILGGVALFAVFVPSEGCDISGNGALFFGVDAQTGGRTNFNVFDINLDERFSDADQVTDDNDESQVVNLVSIPSTVAPITLIASGDGEVVYGLVSGLDSALEQSGGGGDDEVVPDNVQSYALQPPRSTLGRQSWRQLE
ncbi:MAG: hypothetical protein H6978_15605 [Gammaproteobacteria bacterium]|nr:hypothetical protein [Gammaproteobacteria bacterium]